MGELKVRVNGGAVQDGNVTAYPGNTIQLTSLNYANYKGPARFEIYDYRVDFALPAGWTLDASGIMYWEGLSDPPSFTLLEGQHYPLRLYYSLGGERLLDDSTGISVPTWDDFVNLAGYEKARLDPRIGWAGLMKALLWQLYQKTDAASRPAFNYINSDGETLVPDAINVIETGVTTAVLPFSEDVHRQAIIVKKHNVAGDLTISLDNGSDTVDDNATYTLVGPYSSVTFIADGDAQQWLAFPAA